MNLKEYKQRLNKHDWFYMMSDDHRIYESGLAEEAYLEKLASKNKSFKKAYDGKKHELFGTKK